MHALFDYLDGIDRWQYKHSGRLRGYLEAAKRNSIKCNYISMELRRWMGKYVAINAYNRHVYQFTFFRDPTLHFVSAVTHQFGFAKYSNISFHELIDFKLNKTLDGSIDIHSKKHGYNLYHGNFQLNRLLNKYDINDTGFSEDQRTDYNNIYYINNGINDDKVANIINYLSKTFQFIAITEYYQASICYLFYDLYFKSCFS
eukprot:UN05513